MKIYSYSPLPNFETLGYFKKEICQFLKNEGEATFSHLESKFNKNTLSKHLKELMQDGIVLQTESGKYRLRKSVRCVRHRNDGLILTLEDCEKMTGVVTYEEWYDLEEIPEPIRKELLSSGSYFNTNDVLEFDNNYIKFNGIEAYNKELNRLNAERGK